jgi:L-ribulose-5-phosphate 3-epimerase
MHPENKKGTETVELPADYTVGIERMKRIIETAERLNVNIAVENMSRPEYLDCIFRNIQSERLGFCFDSGHCNVFTPEIDFLSLYGDKLIALHLHDNNGTEDWHSLPFSGSINWGDIANKLKAISYNGAIALEVENKKFEHIEEPHEFLRLAVDSSERMRCLCEPNRK